MIRVLLSVALLVPSAASAKVLFTGYGELRMNAHTPYRIHGAPAALTALNIGDDARHHARGFAIENLGLFATTSMTDKLDFKVDFTYRQLGTTVGQVRVQYAYLEHAVSETFSYRLGKVLLPFNYYNRKRFYPFQRVELQAPFFLNSILGLPMASIGADAETRVNTGLGRLDFDVYAVNGYGANSTNANVFRNPTIPGGAGIANNLAATNNNASIAGGARARLVRDSGSEAGLSYYGGAWDSGGSKMLQLFGAHARAHFLGLEVLTELLHMDVSGDGGFAASIEDTHWMTSGYLATVSREGWKVKEMPLTPYVAAEGYVSRGHNDVGRQERLQAYRGGAQLMPLENVQVKAEYGYLRYALPFGASGDVKLWAHQAQLAVVVTY